MYIWYLTRIRCGQGGVLEHPRLVRSLIRGSCPLARAVHALEHDADLGAGGLDPSCMADSPWRDPHLPLAPSASSSRKDPPDDGDPFCGPTSCWPCSSLVPPIDRPNRGTNPSERPLMQPSPGHAQSWGDLIRVRVDPDAVLPRSNPPPSTSRAGRRLADHLGDGRRSLATRPRSPACPSAATAAAWWACLPMSIPTHLSLCWLLPVHPRLLVDHHDRARRGRPAGSSLGNDGSQVFI